MTIDDIIRFFSGAADGQRMVSDQPTVQTPMTQAMDAGAGRGFVNPPQVRPTPMQSVQPTQPVQAPQPALQPLPVTEIPNLPPVAAAMAQEAGAPSAASMAPDNRDIGGGQNFAMQGPSPMQVASGQGKGVLGYLDDAVGYSKPDFLGRLGTALAVAGSQDPTKALMQVQQQRGEEAKIAEARRRANQPKIEPITGTPFFQITYPDGRMETVNNPALARFYQEQSANKAANKRSDMELQADLNAKATLGKADIKASEEAKPLLNDIQSLKGRWIQAKDIVANQGVGAQLQGIPGVASVAGFFGGDEVAKNKFLEGLTVDETLLNTARTKGAISNQEMMLFKSPIPSITDDREKVWKPWIEKRLEVLDKMEKFQAGEVARAPSPAATATPAPAASGGVSAPASKADFDKLPSGTRFRAPDGSIRIKP